MKNAGINNRKYSNKYCRMQKYKMGNSARENEECSDNNGN